MRKLYVLYDRVSLSVEGPIIPFPHDGPAVRMFHSVLGTQGTAPNAHPRDYEFLCVGAQAEDGSLIPESAPRVVATGFAWLQQQQDVANAES